MILLIFGIGLNVEAVIFNPFGVKDTKQGNVVIGAIFVAETLAYFGINGVLFYFTNFPTTQLKRLSYQTRMIIFESILFGTTILYYVVEYWSIHNALGYAPIRYMLLMINMSINTYFVVLIFIHTEYYTLSFLKDLKKEYIDFIQYGLLIVSNFLYTLHYSIILYDTSAKNVFHTTNNLKIFDNLNHSKDISSFENLSELVFSNYLSTSSTLYNKDVYLTDTGKTWGYFILMTTLVYIIHLPYWDMIKIEKFEVSSIKYTIIVIYFIAVQATAYFYLVNEHVVGFIFYTAISGALFGFYAALDYKAKLNPHLKNFLRRNRQLVFYIYIPINLLINMVATISSNGKSNYSKMTDVNTILMYKILINTFIG
ncbi:hypothetical protein A3Q56_06178 [Intoshia linei]|uniref:Uncharacterized protein n=1 Tax=Intoshia linei TaxID=1819745 RepID=A0A177AVQ0_9BILA|nr:hypothetical protein A3Q56_06178 [Intoshia linei]